MMDLSTFQAHLNAKTSLSKSSRHYLNSEEQQLLKWAANLPVQSESEQTIQLEKILAELSVADIDDELCLRFMSIIMTATNRLVATLHTHYIYEVGALSSSQLAIMDQVKSLYYLTALVFESIIRRQTLIMDHGHESNLRTGKRVAASSSSKLVTLAIAIYQSLLVYQKLKQEKGVAYQRSPPYLWSALNKLYYLACRYDISHMDLTGHVITKHATSIHQLYCQVCLHSLLNIKAMRRSSIVAIQRLLPEWATHISATLEPKTQTRIFVDIKSDHPPEYLTAVTSINPYEDEHDCLFIEFEPLIAYLQARQRDLLDVDNAATEYRLLTQVLRLIHQRYIIAPPAFVSNYNPKKQATIITEFSNIHFHSANSRSLMEVIAAEALSEHYMPRHDTLSSKRLAAATLKAETYDDPDITLRIRTLRIPTTPPVIKPLESISSIESNETNVQDASNNTSTNALNSVIPMLRMMTLFLLKEQQKAKQTNLTLALIHWLKIEDKYMEIEGEVLGHNPTACGLRLNHRDKRSQNFVPAFLLTGDAMLDSVFTLLVPSHHFKTHDKVVIRLQDKQQSLRLQRCILMTEEFHQYEVVRL